MKPLAILLKRAYRYYKDYGLVATVIKTYSKITQNKIKRYNKWYRQNTASLSALQQQKVTQFPYAPLMSIIVPTYNTPKQYLREMLESVINQSYANWELCIADGSPNNNTFNILQDYASVDKRIHVKKLTINWGISGNSNAALSLATGEYISFLDHDDVLTPDALFEVVKVLNTHDKPDFIYSDEDKLEANGKYYFDPYAKPDFAPYTFRNCNYICHFTTIKAKLIQKVGPFRSEFDGAQDYDLFLRCTEQTQKIYHIRRYLYHWRAHKNSTANASTASQVKPYTHDAGKGALSKYLQRNHIHGRVLDGGSKQELVNVYRIDYDIIDNPLVSIIIPNCNHVHDLKKCIVSLTENTAYRNYEIIIVENNSTEKTIFDYYKTLKGKSNIRVVTWKNEFNYAAINNWGAQQTQGEYLLFLNNDTEFFAPDWLGQMLGICQQSDVGAVGAKLLYPDDSIQSVGIIINKSEAEQQYMPKDIGRGAFKNNPGYFGEFTNINNTCAVTGACLLTKKSLYIKLGGMDENLRVAYNDVDYCLKVRKAGFLVVVNPYANLHHYESKSRGKDKKDAVKEKRLQEELLYLQKKWGSFLNDPYFNSERTQYI